MRVAHGEDADIWLITWPAGSSTGWHDHGSASGAFVVLDGQLTEAHLPTACPGRAS